MAAPETNLEGKSGENVPSLSKILIVVGASCCAVVVVTFRALLHAAMHNDGFWIFMSVLAILLFLSR